MTIDEAIMNARDLSKFYRQEFEFGLAKEQEQLARWLEELKTYRELKDLIVLEARADAIDECKYKIVDSLEKQLGCKVCSSYEEKYHCSACVKQKTINSTVDILEHLKERNND